MEENKNVLLKRCNSAIARFIVPSIVLLLLGTAMLVLLLFRFSSQALTYAIIGFIFGIVCLIFGIDGAKLPQNLVVAEGEYIILCSCGNVKLRCKDIESVDYNIHSFLGKTETFGSLLITAKNKVYKVKYVAKIYFSGPALEAHINKLKS